MAVKRPSANVSTKSRQASMAQEPSDVVVIALDFGTTFSGIAYCFPNSERSREIKICTVTNWPGAYDEGIHNAAKIPTVVNYGKDLQDFTWGAAAERNKDTIAGVKLLLDPKQDQPIYLPMGNVKKKINKLPKPPSVIVADFIRSIYQYALTEIAREVPESYLRMCRKEFVLSVPALWTDAAKYATQQAARAAGMSPLTLIKEPEAAALYTLHDLGFSISVGDAFVVCDAGGGTVDLISYEVEAVSPKLKLRELVPGTGNICGSLMLNQRFEDTVKNLVGDEVFFQLRKTDAWRKAERSFDQEIKPSFMGKEKEKYYVNFPMADLDDVPDRNLKSNTWEMTGKDLGEIFDPVVKDILRLVDDQVKSARLKRGTKGVTGICLVGGFGASHYLKCRVENAQPGIQVLQPSDAWAAIARGSALSKVPKTASVESVQATRHYGVEASSVYTTEDHGQSSWKGRDGTRRVKRMTWYIQTGDELKRDQTIRFPFYRSIDKDYTDADLIFTDVLFECSDKEAPKHRSKAVSCQKNCEVTVDLTTLPRDQLKLREKWDTKDVPYYDIFYDITLKMESAVMMFSVEVNGKEVGSVEAEYSA